MQQPLMTKSGLLESKCEVHSLISVFLCNGSLMNPSHLPTSSGTADTQVEIILQ